MKKLAIFTILIIVCILTFIFFTFYNKDKKKTASVSETKSQTKTEKLEETKASMKIISTVFDQNQKIPTKYTCDGENISPPLQFLDLPENIKSLALIVDDPDAAAKTWIHWVVYNINPDVKDVEEDGIPEGGTEGMTDFGRAGYGGPCPSSGSHRYFFKLYALDTVLDLPQSATKQMVEEKMQGHTLDKVELIGLYGRE